MNNPTDFWRTERAWYERNRKWTTAQTFERSALWQYLLTDVGREATILEVGAGEGMQLGLLEELGFQRERMAACDVNEQALERCIAADRRVADIVDLPYGDGQFDLVFTSGVLIHVPPTELPKATAGLVRVAGRWVLGYEYWAERNTEIEWRGRKGVLWKANYPAALVASGLTLAKTVYVRHINSDNVDCAYLAVK
jgi:SAM-dependent methyltransferase